MKNGGALIAVGIGLLLLYQKGKQTAPPSVVSNIKTLVAQPKPTTATPINTGAGITAELGGGGGGGDDARFTSNRDLQIYGSGYDIFDLLDAYARSTAQTYRQQYPEPPSVIIAPNDN